MKDKIIKALGGHTEKEHEALVKMICEYAVAMEFVCRKGKLADGTRTHYDWCCTVCKNLGNERKCGHNGTSWCPAFLPCSEFLNSEEG